MNQPTTVPAEQHRIDPMAIDVDAVKVVRRLKEHGHNAYVVGGAVRDLVLKRTPKDFDVATSATPDQIRALFRNSRTIGRRFPIVHVYFHGRKVVEVSTFRREPPGPDGHDDRHPNEFWGTAADDALRRDLTINAFFLDPDSMDVLDFVGGMDDLGNSLIRIVGDPAVRIHEDPVRMIRAIRHAARTGFLIEPATWDAIVRLRDTITTCNESRLRQEFVREFQEGAAARSLKLLHKSGLLQHLLPRFDGFLSGLESRPEQKRVYWKLIKLLDREGVTQDLPGELIFAAAFGPALIPDLLSIFPDKANIDVDKVIKRLDPFLAAAGVPKAMAEGLAQSLYAQPRLDAARGGAVPKRIANKSYYPLALHLFLLRHQAIGATIPEAWVKAAPALRGTTVSPQDNAPGNRKHRRRGSGGDERDASKARSHKRHRNADAAAIPEAPNGATTGEPIKKKRRRGERGRKRSDGGVATGGESSAAATADTRNHASPQARGGGEDAAPASTDGRAGTAESGDGAAKKRGRRSGRRRRKPSAEGSSSGGGEGGGA